MVTVVPGTIGTGSWREAVEAAPPGWLILHAAWARVEPERGRYDDGELERGRAALIAARKRGVEPVVCAHAGALPDWQIAREGWVDPDVAAGWGCYIDRLAHAYGELVRVWVSMWEPLAEAAWYDEERALVARTLLDALATAYLHLKRAPGTAGKPPWIAVVERFASWQEGEGQRLPAALRVRSRLDAALRGRLGPEALVAVLATGRLQPPFGTMGELPNGTPAVDVIGVRWEGGRRVTDGERSGGDDPDALQATLDRVWKHARPLLLVGGPAGAAEQAWERGVRVMAQVS